MKRRLCSTQYHIISFLLPRLLLVCIICMTPLAAFSQNAAPEKTPTPSSYKDLAGSIDKTIETEKEQITGLKNQANQISEYNKALTTEINAYKILLSVNGNLLLLPQAQIEDFEKAWRETKLAVDSVTLHLKNSSQQASSFGSQLNQVLEQQELNKKQLSDIKADASKDPEGKILIKKMQALTDVLVSKQQALKRIHDIYTRQIQELDTILASLSDLSEKFERRIKLQKKQQLFQRKANFIEILNWPYVKEELRLLSRQVTSLIQKPFWQNELRPLWAPDSPQALTFLVLLALIIGAALRFSNYCRRLRQCHISDEITPWRYLALKLVQRTLILLSAGLFIYLFAQIKTLYTTVPAIQTLFRILIILLCTRWGLDVLKFSKQMNLIPIDESRRKLLRYGIIWIRCFSIVYVCVEWLIGGSSVLLMAWRLFFGISLVIWNLFFWKISPAETATAATSVSKVSRVLNLLAVRLCYSVMIGGPVIELAGYGSLAFYWYTSWGRTSVIGLWALIIFNVLNEWENHFKGMSAGMESRVRKPGHTFQWLLIRIGWLLWGTGLLLALLLAWGAKQTVLVHMFNFLQHRFTLGQMHFSLIGLIYGTVILLLTFTSAHLWRYILHERILLYSGLDIGLKDSITTISIYLIWAIGILFALYAVGLSTTSMVVAFGALGIGLGFGLQNIFSNFISGIILLFERPIQVGDAIEINGIWGTVKKINVRSTLVQTYDNASLIIPNSEFISGQVTNWSFKDLRIRRTITVGVAYGSDTEAVRKSLLQVADTVPKILKQPKPDILFSDFGDSALIFKLRIWTTVEDMLVVETNVRFEIDRLFRERNIEIAFPQCDIHIRSMEKHDAVPAVGNQQETQHQF